MWTLTAPRLRKLHNFCQHVFVAFLTGREGAPGCVAGADGMHHICHSTKPYQPKSISKSVEVNFQNQSKTLNQTISTNQSQFQNQLKSISISAEASQPNHISRTRNQFQNQSQSPPNCISETNILFCHFPAWPLFPVFFMTSLSQRLQMKLIWAGALIFMLIFRLGLG